MGTGTPAIFAVMLGAYLVAAIPFGLLVGKLKRVDLRQQGSGNIGATNAWRVLGRPYGLLVFLLDFLKGLGPVVAAGQILWLSQAPWADNPTLNLHLVWVMTAATCVLGHVFPVYLRFKGGKGVATSLGVLLGIYPYFFLPGVAVFALWVVVTFTTRYVALGSIVGAAAFPVLFAAWAALRGDSWSDQPLWPLHSFGIVIAALVVYRHRSNIGRLMVGTEPKIGTSAGPRE